MAHQLDSPRHSPDDGNALLVHPIPQTMLANPKLDASSLNRTSREIAALCEKHAVPCGAPEDLANLLHALGQNKLLAMEFWSLIARVTDRDPAAATDNSLLAVIVEAVTGQTLDEANSASSTERLLVRKFANMLAGEDIHAPIAPGPFAAARDLSGELQREPKQEPKPAAAPLPPRDQQLRLVLDPEPSPAATADPDREFGNGRPVAIPLSAYAETDTRRSTLPRVLAGILLLAAIAGGWFAVHRAAGWKTHASSSPAPQPVAAPAPVPQASVPEAPDAAPPLQSVPTPPPAATPTATTPRATERAAENAASDATSDKPQVVVPEALMRQNLISSRVPVVPNGATARGIVVLDAVITSRGTVEHLRAIEGDPALRRAAIDAASTWHYRPYLLNGTPVDVSTTISVDFSGAN